MQFACVVYWLLTNSDSSEDNYFQKIKHEVLGLVAFEVSLELPLEGGVAQYLPVAPELGHGNLLQILGVVSGCGE